MRQGVNEQLLTLDPGKQVAEPLGPDSGTSSATEYVMGLGTPMAHESQVADAVCHLVSGFHILEGIVEDLGDSSRQRGPVATLAVTAQVISTALEELNYCSLEFWRLLPQARIQASECLPEYCRPLRCGRDSPGVPMESKPREQSEPETLTQGSHVELGGSIRRDQVATHQEDGASTTHSEWEGSLASAVLHLVGAYRAMETLSASAFPAGAPRSFESASHCVCTALVTLDTCLAGRVERNLLTLVQSEVN